jgi:PIN domain nuclease of toxin-antitoxin system
MSYLLDTQIFLWLVREPYKLSGQVLTILRNPSNQLYLSTASVWEMQIKVAIGKLSLPESVQEVVETHRQYESIDALPVIEPHVWSLANLPLIHRDPFDRLIIAQAIAENLTLVSEDAIFTHYPVKLLQ